MTARKRILIACERSGTIRDQFLKAGYDAISSDLQQTTKPGPHYQGNVLDIIDSGFDLMIAHPPCQYLSTAGNHVKDSPGRAGKRAAALEFFMKLYNAPIPRVCIENPQGYVNTLFRQPDQIIHPYYFGDSFLKRTCLWLRGLPGLEYRGLPLFNVSGTLLPVPPMVRFKNKKVHWTESVTGKDRQQARAVTFPGIARAMVQQWSGFVCQGVVS